MAITNLWAGHAYGTNVGKIFLRLEGEDTDLRGNLHFNDEVSGIFLLDVSGKLTDNTLAIHGTVVGNDERAIDVVAVLDRMGELRGGWSSNFGAAGTLVLFPHNVFGRDDHDAGVPAQLHTARYTFGPVIIDRQQAVAIADEMQKAFPNSKLIVTVSADTDQSLYFESFRSKKFPTNEASVLKFYVQEPDREGLNRVISLELGQSYNLVMTQGTDEAWVIGHLEILKSLIMPFTRSYFTSFKRFGLGFNQIILLSAIVVLPSLSNIRERAALIFGVLIIAFSVTWMNSRFFKNAIIYLDEKPPSALQRIGPSLLSLLIAIAGSAAATLLATYLLRSFPSQ